MDLFIGIAAAVFLLILSVVKNIYLVYPLILIDLIFIGIFLRRGFKLKYLLSQAFKGGKKAFVVLQPFVLIGAITAVWMSSGTVPAIVFYGMRLLNPYIFIFSCFVLSAFVSMLIGTSFGTASTIGIALIIMARSGGISPELAAGAIISGALYGDRCSPMSSSANLVATLTGTDLFRNIKNMFRTAWLATFITLGIYMIFSVFNPLNTSDSTIVFHIAKTFRTDLWVLIPALIIIVLSFFKVNVKLSMLVSIIAGFLISIFFQGYSFFKVLEFSVGGFFLAKDNPLYNIISGGGILSMLKVALIVFFSSTLTGLFEGTDAFSFIDKYMERVKTRSGTLFSTVIVSIVSAVFGCTQVMAIILTEQIVKKTYKKKNLDSYELAVDIENTAVVLSPLIPWNIAGLVPATTLGVTSGFIPFAFYLLVLPVVYYLKLWKKDRNIA